jgi:hypothetical protein
MPTPTRTLGSISFFAGTMAVAGALAFVACSSSSGGVTPGGSDAASDAPTGPVPAVGVSIAQCDPRCASCGGVLVSATTGVSFCTQSCTMTSDCPTGTACVSNILTSALMNECLRTCTTDADCAGGTNQFVCRSDLGTPTPLCWTPYPPPAQDSGTTVPDAGSDAAVDSGNPDTGTPVDSGSDASTDAGGDDASDAAGE